MSDFPQPGTQFWYISARNTKIVVLYLGKFPRRKYHVLLGFQSGQLRWVIQLTDEQLSAQMTNVLAGNDPDRLSASIVDIVQTEFRRAGNVRDLVNVLFPIFAKTK